MMQRAGLNAFLWNGPGRANINTWAKPVRTAKSRPIIKNVVHSGNNDDEVGYYTQETNF